MQKKRQAIVVGNQTGFFDAGLLRSFAARHSGEWVQTPAYPRCLAGEHDKALKHLAASIDAGYIGPLRLAQEWPALEPLEGDPRYEAIQARMIEHLNHEREQLGLEPVNLRAFTTN